MKPRISALLHVFLTGVILFSFHTAAGAQSGLQAEFDEANRELVEGDYHTAIERYRNLENRERVSGALFLNMGIAYSRTDSLGMAKYYFLKAQTFEETRQQAAQALEFVESRFSRQSAILPDLPWQIAQSWILTHIGIIPLFAAAVLLINIGTVLFVIRWFVHRHTKWLYRGSLTVLATGLLILVLGFYARHVNERYSEAVMITEEARVHEQPQQEASIVSQAFEGYSFTVDHRKSRDTENWRYVRMMNGTYGWIHADHIRVL